MLPALAPRLPVGLPAPAFAGHPDGDFPWPFYGARYLPGVEATGRPVEPVALGAALRALHSPETLTGIVDWVDVCSSDPAVDLSVAWSSLDEARRPAFFTAYGLPLRDARRLGAQGAGHGRARRCRRGPGPRDRRA